MVQLEGLVAIVTGAGSNNGIGKATAMALAEKGCAVIVADINKQGAGKVASEITRSGFVATHAEVDVTDECSVRNLMEESYSRYGRIDILVNNAGITQPKKFAEMSVSDWNKIITVNLTGTFICSREVVAYMKKNNYGRIISMSSVSGKRGGGVYGGAHYSAAKAGILGFSKAIAREVMEYGITVNCICPGLIATNIREGLPIETEHKLWADIPMKRPGTPQEVAAVITFLAGRDAGYITGEDIDINGGSHMD